MQELYDELVAIVRMELILHIETIAVCTNETLRAIDQIVEREYDTINIYPIVPIRMIAYRVFLFLSE